jgi:hypothetical protein
VQKQKTVVIKGISPLLMHRYPLQAVEAIEKRTREEQAEYAAYRVDGPASNLYIPSVNMQRSLVRAAAYSKGKGRGTLQKQAAACLLVSPAVLDLGTREYAIDSQRVVVPATKGAVVRHRPRLDQWEVNFELAWDPDLLSEQNVRRIVDDAGARVGVLDFRPERGGPYGRFMVVSWW